MEGVDLEELAGVEMGEVGVQKKASLFGVCCSCEFIQALWCLLNFSGYLLVFTANEVLLGFSLVFC